MRTSLDSHVAGCPKCAAFVASYLATPRILREATAAAMPAELQRSLLAFLRAQRGEVLPPQGDCEGLGHARRPSTETLATRRASSRIV